MHKDNIHRKTVEGFGDEWERFDYSRHSRKELKGIFDGYFHIFPWDKLSARATGFDAGCGSGRWAEFVASRVETLYCIDASPRAIAVARKNLEPHRNCKCLVGSIGTLPFSDGTMDFGYSLGVLHHIPDTVAGIRDCVSKLRSGAPFLVYIYYAFDNRPAWFRLLWSTGDRLRHLISRAPMKVRYLLSQMIALMLYFPLARGALVLEKAGFNVHSLPLSYYRDKSLYCMRTDALDRFGTMLEKRFTARQIKDMLEKAGLEGITMSNSPPYWCAVGYKK